VKIKVSDKPIIFYDSILFVLFQKLKVIIRRGVPGT
jgi:hypothetical protein